ncbi:DNA cytosine methyltransferase [Nocardia neocaledoniensis]|uniref:DNA cytosine methyltransferase n=1 Tax=Nocardia neocaledoniensis TaxID=236511 RepID=UPI0024542D67|nr:DNA cytosine methyltransferase [Nocardia neocaledoniensis]
MINIHHRQVRTTPVPNPPASKPKTSVELFAGGGGLAMAVDRAGFQPLLLNEFVKHACDTLEANGAEPRGKDERVPEGGKGLLVRGDVTTLDMRYLHDKVDLLAGGPPCQPFSLGGIAKGDEDKRNMFPEMFRAIREIQPKAVICENVRGLLRPSFRPYFEYILRELEFPFVERDDTVPWTEHDATLRSRQKISSGEATERYQVYKFEVNAADYGVPQIRNRVIILAFRSDLKIDESILFENVKRTHSEAALYQSIANGQYWNNHPGVPKHVRERVIAELPAQPSIDFEELKLRPWRTLRDAISPHEGPLPRLPKIRWNRLDRVQYPDMPQDHVGWPDARIYNGHTPNSLDRPAKTVKAGVHGVPGGESVLLTDDLVPGSKGARRRYRHRYMTVREVARVMTFPDDWILSGPRGEKMRQLGNAVPPLLGEIFAKAVLKVLEDVENRA